MNKAMAMFYTPHNEDIHFSEFNPGPYTLYGHNLVIGKNWGCERRVIACPEDVGTSGLKPEEYFTLIIGEGISEVEPGVIELFVNLKDLIVEAELKQIECTPALEKLLVRNQVILRGSYGSPADKLADRLGLRFIHKNIFLAVAHDAEHYESSEITLCFQQDEPPFIWRDIKTPGISAGNTGGGTVRTDLPEDFYAGCKSAEDFADNFVGVRYWETVCANEELAAFLAHTGRRPK